MCQVSLCLQAPLVIQLTDDEKFLWKDLTQEEAMRLVMLT